MAGPKRTDPAFLETPRGLVTPEGTWFRTTLDQLHESYGSVLEKTEVSGLVRRAETWLNSHRSLALFAVPILLLFMTPFWAVLLGLVVFFGWMLLAPSLGNRMMARVFDWMGMASLQVLFYVVVLSIFGAAGAYPRLLTGVGWFLLIRWQLLDYLSRPIVARIAPKAYPLPLPDQTLRAVIFSEAIRLGISLEGFPSIARWLESDENDKS